MPKFNLDFNIYSSKDRLEAVKQIDLASLTKTELETVTNYILYGKDEDGTSIVDRKEIQIKPKFKSFQKEKTISLEGLMESPTFDENIFQKDRTIYKKVQPSINEEQAQKIPGMVELWKDIDRLQRILDENTGKLEKSNDTPTLTQTQLYYLRHTLIEMRTQQYYLFDSEHPTILGKKNKAEFHDSSVNSHCFYPILPRGVMNKKDDLIFTNPFEAKSGVAATSLDEEKIINSGKPYFDFRNEEHLYQLIQHYGDLKAQISKHPDSLINNLLWTLDFYISKANLSDQQLLIVNDKKFRIPNKDIREHLIKELGIEHRENYISTIWNKAVKLIAEAVELNYDEYLCKDYQKAWKKCNRCGKWLLRDPRNFVRKTKSSDGLTGRCKCCDKDLRQERK